MTTKAATRIGFYLLAAVLLAIQVPRTSLAEEAANQGGTVTSAPGSDSADHVNGTGDNGSAKTDTAKPDSTKPDSGKSEVISPAGGREAGGKPEGVHSNAAVNDGSHFGQARDPGPVDAHIAPPRRHNDNRFSARDPKSRFKIGSSPRLRSGTGHTVTGHVTRNSIGLAVPPQPNKLDRDSKPAGARRRSSGERARRECSGRQDGANCRAHDRGSSKCFRICCQRGGDWRKRKHSTQLWSREHRRTDQDSRRHQRLDDYPSHPLNQKLRDFPLISWPFGPGNYLCAQEYRLNNSR